MNWQIFDCTALLFGSSWGSCDSWSSNNQSWLWRTKKNKKTLVIIKPATDQSVVKVLRAEEGEFIEKPVIVLERQATKPDIINKIYGHFQKRLWQQNQIISMRHQVISSCVTVKKKGCILQDVGTISAMLLATKQDIFNEMSSCVCGDKTRYFKRDPGTFTSHVSGKNAGYFLADNRTNSSHVWLLVRHWDIFQLC